MEIEIKDVIQSSWEYPSNSFSYAFPVVLSPLELQQIVLRDLDYFTVAFFVECVCVRERESRLTNLCLHMQQL